ncbi:MAG TPA: ROK family protein [Clostridiaceae bacterium]|nr:ROK family protein [Clostridiaceae bacterium]
MQKMNRLSVLNYVRRNPNVSRPTIAKNIGLSLPSLTNITQYLIKKNLLVENGTESVDRVGRKSTLLRFYHEAYRLICVYIKVNCINIAYTDLAGNIINLVSINLEKSDNKTIFETAVRNIASFLKQYNTDDILAISIAVSGIVLDDSKLVLSTSLKAKSIDIVSTLKKYTDIPVFLENVTLLRAVWCFSCNNNSLKQDNMIFIDLQDGIGACQFYKGEVNKFMLGEIGHTTVEKDGDRCFCGNKGCLEIMCSPERVMRIYKEISGVEYDVSLEYISDKYKSGEKFANIAVNECAEYLGIGLANIINICKPSVMVINVGNFAPLRPVIERAKDVMNKRAYSALLQDLIIQEVNVKIEQIIEGAAFHTCNKLFDISYPGGIIE